MWLALTHPPPCTATWLQQLGLRRGYRVYITEPARWNRTRPVPWTGSAAVAQPDVTIVKLTYRHVVFQTFQGWYLNPRTPVKKSEKSRVHMHIPHIMLDCLRKVLFRPIWENLGELAHLPTCDCCSSFNYYNKCPVLNRIQHMKYCDCFTVHMGS